MAEITAFTGDEYNYVWGIKKARVLLRGATNDADRRDIARAILRELRAPRMRAPRMRHHFEQSPVYQREVVRRYLDLLAHKRMASPSFGREPRPTIAAIVVRDLDALTASLCAQREAVSA